MKLSRGSLSPVYSMKNKLETSSEEALDASGQVPRALEAASVQESITSHLCSWCHRSCYFRSIKTAVTQLKLPLSINTEDKVPHQNPNRRGGVRHGVASICVFVVTSHGSGSGPKGATSRTLGPQHKALQGGSGVRGWEKHRCSFSPSV